MRRVAVGTIVILAVLAGIAPADARPCGGSEICVDAGGFTTGQSEEQISLGPAGCIHAGWYVWVDLGNPGKAGIAEHDDSNGLWFDPFIPCAGE